MKFIIDKKDTNIRIYSTCYTFTYKFKGKRKQAKIANINTPIEAVRIKASKYHTMILEGKDPFEKINNNILTLDHFCNLYLKKLQNYNGINSYKKYKNLYEKNIKPAFDNKDIAKITNSEIQEWFLNINSKGVANKCLSMLKTIFKLANAAEYTGRYPFAEIKKYPDNKRENYLSINQLISIMQELKAKYEMPNKRPSIDFIWLCILTGARTGEIASATWDDFKGDRIILSAHKTALQTGEKRTIYLSNAAVKIINRQKNNHKRNKYIFAIKSPYRMWVNIRAKFGLDHITLHDLRHSFASHCISYKKLTLKEVGKLLGHKTVNTTNRYAHLIEDETINNVKQIGQFHLDVMQQTN